MRMLGESFAILIRECLLPPETLDRVTSPDGMALGTECTIFFAPALGLVVVWDMVADPTMSDVVRVAVR